jgi:hypothetical protein
MRFLLHSLAVFAVFALSCLPSLANPISVSEIHYAPPVEPEEEFIELINTSNSTYNLAGCQFTSGISYTFGNVSLAPGQRIVVCRDRSLFRARYPSAPNLAASSFSGRLSDDGEVLVLTAANGSQLFRFQYGVDGAWPRRANGIGSSLESINPAANLQDPANWRPSTEYGGSPGLPGTGPFRQIVINELLAHADPPFEDAIELHNVTAQPVDIGGWYLSSPLSRPMRYRIPSGTVIPPGGFRAFYQFQFGSPTPAPGDSPFALNSAYGDEIVLLSTDPSGSPRFWMDDIAFGASGNGISLGRFPDGSGPLVMMAQPTFGTDVQASDSPIRLNEFRSGAGASNSYPLVGPIVFNRIQYHPAPNADEFIELLNTGESAVALFDPFNPTGTWRITDAVQFNFPTGIFIDPGEKFLVAAIQPDTFRSRNQIPGSIRIFGPYTGSLPNDGGRLALDRPDPPQPFGEPDAGYIPRILAEEIAYSATLPWPTGANGTGIALLRRDPAQYGNDPSAWTLDRVLSVPDLQISWDGNVLTVRWDAVPDSSVILEESTSLGGTWNTAATLPVSTASTVVPTPNNERWFRLRRP